MPDQPTFAGFVWARQCLAAGMDDYLSKPLNGKLLHQCIAKWTTNATRNTPP